MKRGWTWASWGIIGILVCPLAIAATSPASAHVAPPASAWHNVVRFTLVERFGPRSGIFDVNNCDPSSPTPFGFATEGLATINTVCTDNIRTNGGHAEAWLEELISAPAAVANVNGVLGRAGLLTFNAKGFAVFTYGANLFDGSFGQIFPCFNPQTSNEGFLILSIYVNQTFDQARQLFLNGEVLYCSIRPNWAAPNVSLEFCNPYFAFSNVTF